MVAEAEAEAAAVSAVIARSAADEASSPSEKAVMSRVGGGLGSGKDMRGDTGSSGGLVGGEATGAAELGDSGPAEPVALAMLFARERPSREVARRAASLRWLSCCVTSLSRWLLYSSAGTRG